MAKGCAAFGGTRAESDYVFVSKAFAKQRAMDATANFTPKGH